MPLRTTPPAPEPAQDPALFAWHDVETEADIEALLQTACGFHDAVVEALHFVSGNRHVPGVGTYLYEADPERRRLSLIVASEWFGRMELDFSGVRKFSFQPFTDNYFSEIWGADVTFRTDLLGKTRDDRLIVWSDGEISGELHLHEPDSSFVIAEFLQWRLTEQEEKAT